MRNTIIPHPLSYGYILALYVTDSLNRGDMHWYTTFPGFTNFLWTLTSLTEERTFTNTTGLLARVFYQQQSFRLRLGFVDLIFNRLHPIMNLICKPIYCALMLVQKTRHWEKKRQSPILETRSIVNDEEIKFLPLHATSLKNSRSVSFWTHQAYFSAPMQNSETELLRHFRRSLTEGSYFRCLWRLGLKELMFNRLHPIIKFDFKPIYRACQYKSLEIVKI